LSSQDLYPRLCNPDVLLAAWQRVRQKGSRGGIDQVSIEAFDKELDKNINQLVTELENGTYIPEPYQELKIPKDDNEYRTLGLPTVKDKVVQQAVCSLLDPIFNPLFLDVTQL
jgi:retron-type reverse transcriptase